jgi:hypothetical protein
MRTNPALFRPGKRRRLLLGLLGSLVLLVPLALLSSEAQSDGLTDLFVDTFGDAMDFSNVEDVAITPNTTFGITDAFISEGQFHGELRSPSWIALLWPGFPGSLPHGREGSARLIGAQNYERLVVRMNAPPSVPVIAMWHTCAAANESCQGGTVFTTQPGWQTYDVALQPTASDQGLQAPWSGRIFGLRLLFPTANGHLDIDWVRVTTRNEPNVSEAIGSPAPFSIDDRRDYATWAGNPWNFDAANDVLSVGGVKSSSVSGGTVAACNSHASKSTGDPHVVLALPGGPINADIFYTLVVSYRYQGAFSLTEGSGGGSLLRVAWKDSAGKRHVSQDIVTYPNERIITVPLRTSPPSAVNEDGASWSGTVTEFRIDPNEDAGERCWNLDRVWLLANEGASLGTPPLSKIVSATSPKGSPRKRAVQQKKRSTAVKKRASPTKRNLVS